MPTLERDLRAYLNDNFVLSPDVQSLAGDASLTRSGIIDSVGVVELIHFLETHFGVELADEELVPENIDTIDNIVRYLGTKLSVGNLVTQVDHGDARV